MLVYWPVMSAPDLAESPVRHLCRHHITDEAAHPPYTPLLLPLCQSPLCNDLAADPACRYRLLTCVASTPQSLVLQHGQTPPAVKRAPLLGCRRDCKAHPGTSLSSSTRSVAGDRFLPLQWPLPEGPAQQASLSPDRSTSRMPPQRRGPRLYQRGEDPPALMLHLQVLRLRPVPCPVGP
ncbi:hypothetical protein NDU88_007740 [Pleurodeles waltl]|uniref:Uncharacterized protein n=1 Tax=Pleurodeles waltl TaxID=8319 RepID=A0AAV7VQK8_PLEWA|nr:hypothetical protein NDU88_007740 [Pleurodeles waltl]